MGLFGAKKTGDAGKARNVDTPRTTSARGAYEPRTARRVRLVKGALLVATLLVCALPVALIAHPISYVPLITVVLLVCTSYAYLRVLKHFFSFDEDQMAHSCMRGSKVDLSVVLNNACILPHARIELAFYVTDLFGEYDAMRYMRVPLGPRKTEKFDFDVRFAHVGSYAAGVDSIVLTDLLGLFTTRIENTSRHQVVVRPRLFDLVEPDISEASENEAVILKSITSDSFDYASVREYTRGDPLKTIHWNLSAKSVNDTLYTRLFETYVSPSLSVVLDPFAALPGKKRARASVSAGATTAASAHAPSSATTAASAHAPSNAKANTSEELMSLFDGLVETTASLSRYARSQGVECVVHYVGASLTPCSACLASDEDLDELVLNAQHITSVDEGRKEASVPLEMLRAEGLGRQGASNVALVTARIDAEELSILSDITACRRQAILFLCVPSTLVGREREAYLAPLASLAALGIPYYLFESTELETRRVEQ